jgi:hypothetical protein
MTEQKTMPGLESDLQPRADHGEERYRGSGKLEGGAAVSTGGDSGIGRAIAIAFAREGADVAVGYLSEKEEGDARETAKWVELAQRRCIVQRLNVQWPSSGRTRCGAGPRSPPSSRRPTSSSLRTTRTTTRAK